jgi:hypothetical protein
MVFFEWFPGHESRRDRRDDEMVMFRKDLTTPAPSMNDDKRSDYERKYGIKIDKVSSRNSWLIDRW